MTQIHSACSLHANYANMKALSAEAPFSPKQVFTRMPIVIHNVRVPQPFSTIQVFIKMPIVIHNVRVPQPYTSVHQDIYRHPQCPCATALQHYTDHSSLIQFLSKRHTDSSGCKKREAILDNIAMMNGTLHSVVFTTQSVTTEKTHTRMLTAQLTTEVHQRKPKVTTGIPDEHLY
ncbi:hypothetical protein ACOMHN_052904 [Nucella lapillus]